MVEVNRVADYFIRRSHEVGDPITNMKLQKLVYYAQAWYAALYGKRLLAEDFQAWVHGPVCPELYGRFKGFKWNPITTDVQLPHFSPKVTKHLDDVFEVYGGFTAFDLERITHNEKPWKDARGDMGPAVRSGSVISVSTMRDFYRRRLSNGAKEKSV